MYSEPIGYFPPILGVIKRIESDLPYFLKQILLLGLQNNIVSLKRLN